MRYRLRDYAGVAGALVTVLLGALLVGEQALLYLEDGTWYSATILEIATYDLDPRLADAIGLPILASWHDAHEVFAGNAEDGTLSTAQIREQARDMGLPDLAPWRVWLNYPESWVGMNRIVAGVLGVLDLGLVCLIVSCGVILLGAWSRHRSQQESGAEPASYD